MLLFQNLPHLCLELSNNLSSRYFRTHNKIGSDNLAEEKFNLFQLYVSVLASIQEYSRGSSVTLNSKCSSFYKPIGLMYECGLWPNLCRNCLGILSEFDNCVNWTSTDINLLVITLIYRAFRGKETKYGISGCTVDRGKFILGLI